jgi:hypothetical protein
MPWLSDIISNLILATSLAAVAAIVQRMLRRLARWLLVLRACAYPVGWDTTLFNACRRRRTRHTPYRFQPLVTRIQRTMAATSHCAWRLSVVPNRANLGNFR